MTDVDKAHRSDRSRRKFALRVVALRLRHGLQQGELAEACGLSQGFVCQLETGARNPSPRVTAALADALRTNPAYLRSGVGKAEIDAVIDLIRQAHAYRAADRITAAANDFTQVLWRATATNLTLPMQQAALGLAAAARSDAVGPDAIAALDAGMAALKTGTEPWVALAAARCRCQTAIGALTEATRDGETALNVLGRPEYWSYTTVQLALAVLDAHLASGHHTYPRLLADMVFDVADRMSMIIHDAVRDAARGPSRTTDPAPATPMMEQTLSLVARGRRSRLGARAQIVCAQALLMAGPPHAERAAQQLQTAGDLLAVDDPAEAARARIGQARAQLAMGDPQAAVKITGPLLPGLSAVGPLIEVEAYRTHATGCLYLQRRTAAAGALRAAAARLERVPASKAGRLWSDVAICHELLGDQARYVTAMRRALAVS